MNNKYVLQRRGVKEQMVQKLASDYSLLRTIEK